MARGKVQLKQIENPIHRQVTFCKRRTGLLKKARELSMLCDADIGLMIFSTRGKFYELATKGTMQGLIERYTKHSRGPQVEEGGASNHVEMEQEISILKREVHLLQNAMRYMFGGGSGTMKLDELHALENYLEIWMCKIRSLKNQAFFQEIQYLKNQILEPETVLPREGTNFPVIKRRKVLQIMLEESDSVTFSLPNSYYFPVSDH